MGRLDASGTPETDHFFILLCLSLVQFCFLVSLSVMVDMLFKFRVIALTIVAWSMTILVPSATNASSCFSFLTLYVAPGSGCLLIIIEESIIPKIWNSCNLLVAVVTRLCQPLSKLSSIGKKAWEITGAVVLQVQPELSQQLSAKIVSQFLLASQFLKKC